MKVHLKDTNLVNINKFIHYIDNDDNDDKLNLYNYQISMLKIVLNDGWVDDVYDDDSGLGYICILGKRWKRSYKIINNRKFYFHRNADTY